MTSPQQHLTLLRKHHLKIMNKLHDLLLSLVTLWTLMTQINHMLYLNILRILNQTLLNDMRYQIQPFGHFLLTRIFIVKQLCDVVDHHIPVDQPFGCTGCQFVQILLGSCLHLAHIVHTPVGQFVCHLSPEFADFLCCGWEFVEEFLEQFHTCNADFERVVLYVVELFVFIFILLVGITPSVVFIHVFHVIGCIFILVRVEWGVHVNNFGHLGADV